MAGTLKTLTDFATDYDKEMAGADPPKMRETLIKWVLLAFQCDRNGPEKNGHKGRPYTSRQTFAL
jgi:hypothetical protein